jgi:hypothetical protein
LPLVDGVPFLGHHGLTDEKSRGALVVDISLHFEQPRTEDDAGIRRREGLDRREILRRDEILAGLGSAVTTGTLLPDLDVPVDLLVDVRILDAREHVGREPREDIDRRVAQRDCRDRRDRATGVAEEIAKR